MSGGGAGFTNASNAGGPPYYSDNITSGVDANNSSWNQNQNQNQNAASAPPLPPQWNPIEQVLI